jgi:predicted permease
MRWHKTLLLRLRSLFLRSAVEADLDEELQFHLDHLIKHHTRAGHSPAEARRLALIEMGGPTQAREHIRDTRGLGVWETLTRDIRLAARSLRHSRGFATAIVTSLALGLTLLGTTTAIVDAYLIRSLPAEHADRLFHVWYSGAPGQVEPGRLSALDWTAVSDVVEVADSSIFARYIFTDSGPTQELTGLQVSQESLGALGLHATLGRSLRPDDFVRGEMPALIGDHLWRDQFGADPGVIGQPLRVTAASSGAPLTFRVVGVLPPGFRYVRELSRPALDLVSSYLDRGRAYMIRLRAGVPSSTAEDRINSLVRNTSEIVLPANWPGVRLESVRDRYVAPIRPTLTSAWLASAFVLLIVVANVTILVLLRSLRRQREVAVRLALGAGTSHLVRSVVTEAVLVCGAALLIAMMLSTWLLSTLGPEIERSLGRVIPGGTLSLGGWMLTGVLAAGALVVAVTMSVVTFLALRRTTAGGLTSSVRAGGDRPSIHWMRSGLITLEIAGSIALLAGCGLMVRTALALLTVDLGFTATGVMRSRVALPVDGSDQSRGDFYTRFQSEIRTRAGADVAFANWTLFSEAARTQDVRIDGHAASPIRAAVTAVSDGYTSVLGIPVLAGRALTPADTLGAPPVAVVSDTLARRLWADGNAVGHRLRGSDRSQAGESPGPWRTIVGVVGNVRQTPEDEDLSDVYVPLLQAPTQYASVMIRSNEPTQTWLRELGASAGRIEPRAIVALPTSLEVERDRLLSSRRLLASLMTGLAVFAMLLTVLGVYGVTAHGARQREGEAALRLALGATPGQIARLFLGGTVKILVAGAGIGLAGAALVGRSLESMLHHVTTFDPPTIVTTIAGLLIVALLAAWLPVRRTSRMEPSRLLRDL